MCMYMKAFLWCFCSCVMNMLQDIRSQHYFFFYQILKKCHWWRIYWNLYVNDATFFLSDYKFFFLNMVLNILTLIDVICQVVYIYFSFLSLTPSIYLVLTKKTLKSAKYLFYFCNNEILFSCLMLRHVYKFWNSNINSNSHLCMYIFFSPKRLLIRFDWTLFSL